MSVERSRPKLASTILPTVLETALAAASIGNSATEPRLDITLNPLTPEVQERFTEAAVTLAQLILREIGRVPEFEDLAEDPDDPREVRELWMLWRREKSPNVLHVYAAATPRGGLTVHDGTTDAFFEPGDAAGISYLKSVANRL